MSELHRDKKTKRKPAGTFATLAEVAPVEVTEQQTQKHKCARPRCQRQVQTKFYACPSCWHALPDRIRGRISYGWNTKKQEIWDDGNRQALEHWATPIT